ncbi:MAG: hypothetical protein HOF71_08790 [Chloroflexi bacterium]|nr:hypothetical protein [Chloroflexota bacterium]
MRPKYERRANTRRVRHISSMKGMSIVLAMLLVLSAAMIIWIVTDDVRVSVSEEL